MRYYQPVAAQHLTGAQDCVQGNEHVWWGHLPGRHTHEPQSQNVARSTYPMLNCPTGPIAAERGDTVEQIFRRFHSVSAASLKQGTVQSPVQAPYQPYVGLNNGVIHISLSLNPSVQVEMIPTCSSGLCWFFQAAKKLVGRTGARSACCWGMLRFELRPCGCPDHRRHHADDRPSVT